MRHTDRIRRLVCAVVAMLLLAGQGVAQGNYQPTDAEELSARGVTPVQPAKSDRPAPSDLPPVAPPDAEGAGSPPLTDADRLSGNTPAAPAKPMTRAKEQDKRSAPEAQQTQEPATRIEVMEEKGETGPAPKSSVPAPKNPGAAQRAAAAPQRAGDDSQKGTGATAVASPAPSDGTARGRLGMYYLRLAPSEKQRFGITENGPAVSGVVPGTAADLAGIQPGDVILAVEGKPVKSDKDIMALLKGRSAGEKVNLTVSRRGVHSNKLVTLTPAASNAAVELVHLATAGQPWAQAILGTYYFVGTETKQDYAKARLLFQKAGEGGVELAQFWYAGMLEKGQGGPADLVQARVWYEKGVAAGDRFAKAKLAAMLAEGRGGPKDEGRAAQLYGEAAREGDVASEVKYAEMLTDGRGVERNGAEAAQMYRKAADAGNLEAAATLGNWLAAGNNVKQDYAEAVKRLTQAANGGVARAQHDLGALYSSGRGVARDAAQAARWLNAAAEKGYTPAQAALGDWYCVTDPPDYAKALVWLTKAADKGEPQALNALGRMYYIGQGVPKDVRKAFDLQMRAAKAGNDDAKSNVAVYYIDGVGVERNLAEALRWLEPIGDQGEQPQRARIQNMIGLAYYVGDSHVRKDLARARIWFEKAANAGNVDAQQGLAKVLFAQKRYPEAAGWYRKAAEKGNRAAQNELGLMYLKGQGVPQNRTEGLAWLVRAYQQGSTAARDTLRKMGVEAK